MSPCGARPALLPTGSNACHSYTSRYMRPQSPNTLASSFFNLDTEVHFFSQALEFVLAFPFQCLS